MPFRSSGRGAYGPQGQRVLKGPLAPVWTTSGTLTGATTSAYSFQLVATDDSGDAPTYSLASGSLNPGLSLSSTGLISGTPTGTTNTANFTVRATDVNGRFTDSGTLTIVATLATTITFDLQAGAGGAWTQDSDGRAFGGRIFSTAPVTLPGGVSTIYLLVGSQGGDESARKAAGGGGYTALWYGNSNPVNGTWLYGAGGGGGENAGDTGGNSTAGQAGGTNLATGGTGKGFGSGGSGQNGGSSGGAGNTSGGGAGGSNACLDVVTGGGGGSYAAGRGPGGDSGCNGVGAVGGYGGGGGGGGGGNGSFPGRGDPGAGGGGGYIGGNGGNGASGTGGQAGWNYAISTSNVTSQAGVRDGNGVAVVNGTTYNFSESIVTINV